MSRKLTNGHSATARARVRKLLRDERPLRLRGRREFVTAMVDALNDILESERTLY